MPIYRNRPVIMNMLQFQSRLENGSMTAVALLDKAEELGVDGVEFRREPWRNYRDEIHTVREKAERLGKVVIYATFSRILCKEEESERLLFHDIDTAAELGSPFLRIYLGETSQATCSQWNTVRKAIDYAFEKGIYLALENCSYMPGATLDEILNAIRVTDSPLLKMNVDVGNYHLNHADPLDAISKLGDRIIYTHLKDPSGPEGVPGGGKMPMNDILDALDALPQTVYYCFEFGGGTNPEERIGKSIDFLKARLGRSYNESI